MLFDKTPKISVIIPTYNFERYLTECIESILAQTLRPFEIIICDDHSTDQSWAIISEYSRKFPELIKSYRHERNTGMVKNYNFGYKKATGELICDIDGDDRWLPQKLELEWKALQSHPEAKIAFSKMRYIDAEGRPIMDDEARDVNIPSLPDLFVEMYSQKLVIPRNELMYRSIFEEIGYCDENIEIFIDWDFKIRSAAKFLASYSGEVLVEYRLHDQGIHNSPIEKIFRDMLYVYTKNLPLLSIRTEDEARNIKRAVESKLLGFVLELKQACVERLDLIQYLHGECDRLLKTNNERLLLIDELTKTAEERLMTIQQLDAEVKRLSQLVQG
jgi:glycosyltransferase involved in cell wall biosynthesis